jgi:hypothetical protein
LRPFAKRPLCGAVWVTNDGGHRLAKVAPPIDA